MPEPKRFGEVLRAIDHYAATTVVRAALKLAPMLLLRPGELRIGEWSEIDLDKALWTVPAVRMKRQLRQKLHGAPHLVPLPKQAVAVLRELHALTGHAKMVFGRLMEKAFNSPPIPDFDTVPVRYRGAGDDFLGPSHDVPLPTQADCSAC